MVVVGVGASFMTPWSPVDPRTGPLSSRPAARRSAHGASFITPCRPSIRARGLFHHALPPVDPRTGPLSSRPSTHFPRKDREPAAIAPCNERFFLVQWQ